MKDAYYTPTVLAEKLISLVPENQINTVADFCVGDGQLLRAAESRWANATFCGTDICKDTLRNVRKAHPNWNLGLCDFLKTNSKNQCHVLRKCDQGFDLVVLNPPFSCIGGSKYTVELDGQFFDCSTAMKFTVEALRYLSNIGQLFAILPNSVAYSEKDARLVKYLREYHNFNVHQDTGQRHFENCASHVILISLKSAIVSDARHPYAVTVPNVSGIQVIRGRIQMHSLKNSKQKIIPLIHTTDLGDYRVHTPYRWVDKAAVVKGPFIAIPRVGNPNVSKVCMYLGQASFALSDCVVVLTTGNVNMLQTLHKHLVENWDRFKELYSGTGAKYITIKRIKSYLGMEV